MVSRRSVVLATCAVMVMTVCIPSSAYALPYDGTNPGASVCGNGSHPVVDLGLRTDMSPGVTTAQPTNIMYGSTVIGTVEIRHSPYCGTVWARVTNLTSGSVQARETIWLYSTSNGGGTTISQTETDTLTTHGSTGWSMQYRDRASFKAQGSIYYAGDWRTAYTVLTPAWNQYDGAFPSWPYGCDHTAARPCRRWPTTTNGGQIASVTRYYYIYYPVSHMPSGDYDVAPDVRSVFNQFNGIAAPNPFFFEAYDPNSAQVSVFAYYEQGVVARGGSSTDASGYYVTGLIKLSTDAYWGDSNSNKRALCHEYDHLFGLKHVWEGPSGGPDIVGSKATCIGAGYTGPYIDDVSALDSVYRSSVP